MREALKKALLAFFAVLLIFPVAFFVRPQPADALVGCLIGSLVNKLLGKTQELGSAISGGFSGLGRSVPTNDSGTQQAIGRLERSLGRKVDNVKDETATLKRKECTLDGMVTLAAKTMLQTLTRGIVDWINRGFEGEPAFVTNPEGFLTDVADKVIGQEIEAVAPFLCQPFRLQLQFSLGFQYSYRSEEEVRCRLSDVISNVRGSYQGFVGGDFSQGGWQRWLQITTVPQNNAYGAYLATNNKIQAGIVTATGQEIRLLDWGKGFQSWRSCNQYEQITDPVNGKPRKGRCLVQGEIKTPGSIIVDQTSGALKSRMEELQVADEIDEIIGALVNQLLSRAMGGVGGLLGTSRPNPQTGVRYVDTLITNLEAAQAAADAPSSPPAGIDCKQEVFYVQGSDSGQNAGKLMLRKTDNSLEIAKIPGTDNEVVIDDKYKTSGKIDWVKYFTDISRGCANTVDRFLTDGANEVAETIAVSGPDTSQTLDTTTPTQTVETNLAVGKLATQSTNCTNFYYALDAPFASVAIDGNRASGNQYGQSFSCTNSGKNEWWQVDLESNGASKQKEWNIEEIKEIIIYRPAGYWDTEGFASQEWDTTLRGGKFKVSILDANKTDIYSVIVDSLKSSSNPPYTYNHPIYTIPIPSNKKGRYVRIEQYNAQREMHLIIAEVEVFGKQTPISQTGTGTVAEEPLSITVNPPKGARLFSTLTTDQSPRAGERIKGALTLTANRDTKPNEKIAISAQLAPRNSTTGTPFSNIFTITDVSLKAFFARVTKNNVVISETPSFVFYSETAIPQTRMNPALALADDLGWKDISQEFKNKTVALNLASLDLRTAQDGSKYLNATGKPVYIIAGLDLKKDDPVTISFEGTLSSGIASDYDLLINVYKGDTGTYTPAVETSEILINIAR